MKKEELHHHFDKYGVCVRCGIDIKNAHEKCKLSEETLPTGEKEWEKRITKVNIYGHNVFYIDFKPVKEAEQWTDFIREQLSLAREEGRKYQRELDEMINGVSIQDSNLERGKKYVVISQETYDSLTNQSKESENTPS